MYSLSFTGFDSRWRPNIFNCVLLKKKSLWKRENISNYYYDCIHYHPYLKSTYYVQLIYTSIYLFSCAGFMGLFDCLILLPVLLLWHFVHLETFEAPPTPNTWTLLLVNGLAGTVLSELLWLWWVGIISVSIFFQLINLFINII